MQIRNAVIAAAAVSLLGTALLVGPQPRLEAQGSGTALSGEVTSKEEGKMEGVAVTAEREGANFRVSVYSDAKGRYAFPRTRLEPGAYALTIRAAGYDLVPPGAVQVSAGKTATANLTLTPTSDLSKQLSSREWITSAPGSDEIKNKVVAAAVSCTYCHSLERIFKTKYTAEQWVAVITRMQKYFVDGTAVPQGTGRAHAELESESARLRADKNPEWYGVGTMKTTKAELGEYLASVNLSGGRTQFPFQLKPLPRPKGPATRIIVTAWDAPRKDSVIHDGETDSKGRVWFNSENASVVGMLDPKTNTFAEYPIPRASKLGSRDIMIDKSGNVWLPMRSENGSHTLYKFDTTTHVATAVEGVSAGAYGDPDPSGKYVWTGFVRVDAATAKLDRDFRQPATGPRPNGYGFVVSSKGVAYGTDYMQSAITSIDIEKNEGKAWPTPRPHMLPRRGRMDSQDRFWMGFYGGDAIGMLDTRTEKWTEWKVPMKFTTPYTATVPDRKGYVYSPTHTAEAVLRLDPKTGEFLEYPMPTTPGNFDGKKVSFDPTAKNTVIFFSNPRNAQIIRVEFLD